MVAHDDASYTCLGVPLLTSSGAVWARLSKIPAGAGAVSATKCRLTGGHITKSG